MRTELLRERYEPLEVVGRGGEGEVIRALDHLHGRQVALKVRPVADEASRTHLLSEARLLLSLSPHPGLPLVREDFFVDERYVIAMDWIEGTDLEALLDVEGRPGLDPALADRLPRTGRRGAGAPSHSRPTCRARRRQAGEPDPHLLRPGRPRRLRTVLHAHRRPAPGGHGRLRGTGGRGRGETDRGVGRVLVRRHGRGAAHRRASLRGRAELGRDRARADPGAGADRAPEPGHRSGASRCIGGRLRRQAAALVGRRPPERERSRSCWPTSAPCPRRARRTRWTRSPVRTGGHCVSPVDDGPLTVAFASAQDGLDAARELAGRFDARVAAVTGKAEPRAGSYRGESASGAARLLTMADRGQVLIDDATAETIDGRLPPEIGLAEVRDTASPTGRRRGRSSRPVCRSRHAPTPAPTAG